MTSSYGSDPARRGSGLSHSFVPLALIALGVVFLLGNLVPERGRGGLVLLGLGVTFLIGRATTGRYGYAVPAGLLIALGAYVGLHDVQDLRPTQGPGLFFVLFGLGFALVYLIGGRPEAVWPMFPAAIFLAFGLIAFGVTSLAPLAAFGWMVSYWPAALVLVGLWLLFRDQLPAAMRRPIATVGGLALLAYGILAAAASMATGGTLARTGLAATFSTSPFADTVTLDAPLSDGQTLAVNNPNGRTTIRGSSRINVHVVATKRYNLGGDVPEVRLTPGSTGLSLDASTSGGRHFPFGGWNSVDYAIEVPALTVVTTQSSSGDVEIEGVNGSVQATTKSGALKLSNLGGDAQARSGSGSVDLNNIAGEVRVSTGSGQIHGTDLRHVREVTSGSGSISVQSVYTEQAHIRATSGRVNVKLLPGSAVQLNVRTSSGSINSSPSLSGDRTDQRALTGSIGVPVPGATLSIETSSGSIQISQ
jgi:hypothetical protein